MVKTNEDTTVDLRTLAGSMENERHGDEEALSNRMEGWKITILR
jgi:tRNA A-37 threonylcarbamoyl transferase component Bud32